MNCNACGEQIPTDSMFCPECGARQDTSVAGGFTPPANQAIPPFPPQQRSFDPVSGQAQRMQQESNMNQGGQVPPDMLQGMAQGIHQQQNLPPGTYPQQPIQGGFPPNQFPPNQVPPNQFPPGQFPPQQGNVMPTNVQAPMNDMPNPQRGPSIASGVLPASNNVSPMAAGGTKVAQNPANSPTDAMVNRLAEAERAVKDERRNQWLSMNQSPASSVLANLGGGELPAHLRGSETSNPAADIMAGALGAPAQDAPSEALLRRISEVAVRRVARKRGVAVEAPQTKLADDLFEVNITYVDDGRVLDSPDDLTQAFEHAIQTELALKGFDLSCSITMFRSKDGKTEKIGEEASDEEMFACEICDGLVKESDPVCPHCGAMFEDEEEEVQPTPSRRGPPGPKKSGPPGGPKKGGAGGPPGPKKGGSGGPPGPKKGGPPGPKKGGPPGGPKKGGPPGPKKSGPPGGPKKGGPPGPKKSGPPGGPKKGGPGGPPGPKKGGPPGGPKKGGPGGPPGPKKGGPPGGPKKGGPPGGPKKGGPGGPPGPKKGGPPGGPKRGPPGR